MSHASIIVKFEGFHTGDWVYARPWGQTQRAHITQNFWFNQFVQL